MNQEEIRIQDLVYILASGWKIVVGALVAGVLLAQVFTALSTEGVLVYAADASMVINSKTYSLFDGDIEVAESNNVYLSQKMVNTYRVILLSDNVLDRVIQDLAIDFTPEGLRTHIEVSSPKDTEVIMVTVTHTDPLVATQIANAIMRLAPEVIYDTVEVGTIVVLDEAKLPTAAVKSRQSLLNLLIGGVLGLMVGVFAVFFLWFLKPKVRNKKDILENLNLKCLGEIPHVKLKYRKSPRQMMVTHPGIPFFFLEASKILAQKILYIARENHYKVFAVTSVGPEEGKTTLSVNTALSLASADNKVLLMDFDFYKKGSASIFTRMKPIPSRRF